jgi:hypothetical protein
VVVGNDERGWGKKIRERAEAEGGETLVASSGLPRCTCGANSNQCRGVRALYARGGLSTTLQAKQWHQFLQPELAGAQMRRFWSKRLS